MALTSSERQTRYQARRKKHDEERDAEIKFLLARNAELEAEVAELKKKQTTQMPRKNTDWQGRPLFRRVAEEE